MKIYDISQEVFSCKVYEGDPKPEKTSVSNIDNGALYNLSCLSTCVHNGTHIDAPLHFFANGDGVDEIPLNKTVGFACVVNASGIIDEKTAKDILQTANRYGAEAASRILIKGDALIDEKGALTFANANLNLIGVEAQSVSVKEQTASVHKILLDKKIVLLEGITLSSVNSGAYLLAAQPLNLSKTEGSPCRAVLIDLNAD